MPEAEETPGRGPALSPAATLAQRFDPDLFHAALFAPEPARERLMVLTAFDIELSRAAGRARNTQEGLMMAAMRLQFWQDRVEGVRSGATPAAHEVAEPLHALLAGPLAASVPDALQLIAARRLELELPFDHAAFAAWSAARFESWYRLCLAALGLSDPAAATLAGRASAHAFVIRHAVAMAGEGRALLPGLQPAEQSLLAQGDVTPALAETLKRMAAEGLDARIALRERRGALGRAAAPAFLPLWRAERDLVAASSGLPGGGKPMPTRATKTASLSRSVAYLWRATTGRW